MTFEKIKDENMTELDSVFAGMKVDVFDENTSKWSPGTVDKI